MNDFVAISALSISQIAQRQRCLRGLIVLYLSLWSALAISPIHRQDWALENVLVLAYALVLVLTRKRVPLSCSANTLVFVFLLLHAIGAHYTYSEVPYAQWLRSAFNVDINTVMSWQRNHFDRAIHLAYGLLLALPVREWCLRVTTARDRLSYVLPLLVLCAFSVFYEMLEWSAALVFGADLGLIYVGAQGDIWDAQQDMALANGGAILVISLRYVRDRFCKKKTTSSHELKMKSKCN